MGVKTWDNALVTIGQVLVLIFGLTLFFQATTQPLPRPSALETDSIPLETPEPADKAIYQTEGGPSDSDSQITVTKVIDGDTIEISTGQRVRYIGIDTPESVDPRSQVQCFGVEAANANRSLVQGKKVRLEKDISETDRYGRLLRYVWVGETLVNDYLVRQGFARASSYPPDIKYQEIFRQSEAKAQAGNIGMWAGCSSGSIATGSSGVSSKTPPDPSCPIKGNISSGGKIYHLPGGSFYDRTVIDTSAGERWFCSETEANLAGWRKSKR